MAILDFARIFQYDEEGARRNLLRRMVLTRVEERFEDLAQLVEMTEIGIRRRHADLVADTENGIVTGAEIDAYSIDLYQDEERQLTQDFPQLLRATLIASTHAALEFFLLRIANTWAAINRSEFVQTDWDRARIWAVKRYMEQVNGKTGLPHWSKIDDYNSIRNAISHGDGHITETLKNRPQVEAAAERLKAHVNLIPIEGSTDMKISLDQRAVEDFIKISRALCRELLTG